MYVCISECVWHVHIHMDTHPSSVHYRQLNQEGEEYFSWCYFYDNLFRWLIWFRTLIYHQFIDLSLSLFLLSYWIIRMACVKWNFLAYCSASHATSVVQTIKRSIKLIYTQSERGKRGTETENGECFGIGYHVYLSLVNFRIKIYMRKRHKWGMKVVLSCEKRSSNSSLPLLHRKQIFLLFFFNHFKGL